MAHRAGSLPRRLAAGCYGALELDFACGRGHAFTESWLHQIIAKIIGSAIDPATKNLAPSYPAAAIQKAGRISGRKRELDFAITDRVSGAIDFCIEAKWAESRYCTPESILDDVARLAVMHKENTDTVCLLVLAGGKRKVSKLFTKGPLLPPAHLKHGVLAHPYDSGRSTFPVRNNGHTNSALSPKLTAKLVEYLPDVPRAIQTIMYAPSHITTPNWSVIVWRIYSVA
jgi:hypothetical protein